MSGGLTAARKPSTSPSRLRRIRTQVLHLPWVWLSLVMPRRRDLWVFGSWYGERYGDSARALYEWLPQHHPEITAVWLSTNPEVVARLRSEGRRAELTYSPRGYWVSMRASWGFIVTALRDLNAYALPPHILNLWHGHPLKRIGFLSQHNQGTRRFNSLRLLVFPHKRRHELSIDTVASSPEEAAIMAPSFRVPVSQVHVTGLPRNDKLRPSTRGPLRDVVYMPTHRLEGAGSGLDAFIAELATHDEALRQLGITLHVKMHFYHGAAPLEGCTNVKQLIIDDIYEVLHDFDALVTDYSSIYFDYLLTQRPIIFTPFDLEDYVTQDRALNYDYEDATPGPKVRTWAEVVALLAELKAGTDSWAPARAAALTRFHTNEPGTACERVYEYARSVR